ncbi:MAG: hypothetical protein IKN53_03070 [Oscillibacter sp.]|nr:hypothetical protein [Oscillibacter sp.]
MEKCEFCDTVQEDGVKRCPACGGNSFVHVCNQCGTEFKEGTYCPRCGVRAGEKARTCPECGAEYFSDACPKCGYIPGRERVVVERTGAAEEAPKKRHTLLWVLGWLFCFPVPLTILIARSGMKKGLKIALIAILWAVVLAAGTANDEKTQAETAPSAQQTQELTLTPSASN